MTRSLTLRKVRQEIQTQAILFALFAGCSAAQAPRHDARGDSAQAKQMTVRQARRALVESIKHAGVPTFRVLTVSVDRHKVVFTGDYTDGAAKPENFSWLFAGVTAIKVKRWTAANHNVAGYQVLAKGTPLIYFERESDARMLVDALLTLKVAELAPDNEEADFAAFTTNAKAWLGAEPKPTMSDDARAYEALAEDSFKRKDFAAALDAYCEALDRYPMWPEGQYNAALLAAEAEDYELAAHHMRRYLTLAPDATDSAAAKNKFLLWQLKAKQ